LRYNTRGYESSSSEPVDVDVLADDLAGLLDSLGVQSCFAVVGVSLGGVTCMNFTIRYPSRLDKYIACDCNVASSDNNSKAWVARVSLARSEGGLSELASRTVERWFSAASLESQTKAVSDVRRMILCASVDGYVGCVAALCDF